MLFFTLNFKQEWRIAAYIVKIMKVKYILKKHFSNERLFLVFHFLSLRSNLFSGLADLHGMKDKENISLLMAEANPVGIIFAFPGINTASNAIIIIIHLQGVDEKWSRQERPFHIEHFEHWAGRSISSLLANSCVLLDLGNFSAISYILIYQQRISSRRLRRYTRVHKDDKCSFLRIFIILRCVYHLRFHLHPCCHCSPT